MSNIAKKLKSNSAINYKYYKTLYNMAITILQILQNTASTLSSNSLRATTSQNSRSTIHFIIGSHIMSGEYKYRPQIVTILIKMNKSFRLFSKAELHESN